MSSCPEMSRYLQTSGLSRSALALFCNRTYLLEIPTRRRDNSWVSPFASDASLLLLSDIVPAGDVSEPQGQLSRQQSDNFGGHEAPMACVCGCSLRGKSREGVDASGRTETERGGREGSI